MINKVGNTWFVEMQNQFIDKEIIKKEKIMLKIRPKK